MPICSNFHQFYGEIINPLFKLFGRCSYYATYKINKDINILYLIFIK